MDVLEANGIPWVYSVKIHRKYRNRVDFLRGEEHKPEPRELSVQDDASVRNNDCGFVERKIGGIQLGNCRHSIEMNPDGDRCYESDVGDVYCYYDEGQDVSMEVSVTEKHCGEIRRILVYRGEATPDNIGKIDAAYSTNPIRKPLNLITRPSEDYETPRGIRLGMPLDEAVELLGDPSRQQHHLFPVSVARVCLKSLFYETDYDQNRCVEMFYTAIYSFDAEDKLSGFMLYDGRRHTDVWWLKFRIH
jgi:hypothetical protein